jgi:hypothetical protein
MGRLAMGLSPPIQQLRPWQRSMARHVALGLRPSDLAKHFDYTPGQISRIIQSPLFVAEVERLQSGLEESSCDVRRELETMLPRALENIDESLYSPDPKRRDTASFEILDRTGYGKQQGVQRHVHLHAHKEVEKMSDEDLESAVYEMLQVEGEAP